MHREYRAKYRSNRRGHYLVKEAKARATKAGLAFALDDWRDHIQQRVANGVCEMTGIPFNFDGGQTWDSPSLDRINPEDGYTIENVRVVLFSLNVMMNSWGEEKVLEVVEALQAKQRAEATVLDKWEANLMTRLSAIGSTELSMTWKRRVTPAGRQVWQHVPSTPRTSEAVSTGSPLQTWPTPTSLAHAKDGNNEAGNNEAGNSAGLVAIREHALASTWSTPRASDGEKGGPNMAFGAGGTPLPAQAAQSTWVTPSARDWKDGPGMATTGVNPDGSIRNRVDQLPRQVAATEPTGPTTSGSPERTGKRGALNPEFVCWLMGYPPEWVNCAPSAMPSSRKSRPK